MPDDAGRDAGSSGSRRTGSRARPARPCGEGAEARAEHEPDGGRSRPPRVRIAAAASSRRPRQTRLAHFEPSSKMSPAIEAVMKRDERAREQRPESQAREIRLARGGEAADPADLDPDRGEVREAAQGERRDQLALLRELPDHVLHHREGEELVDHRLVGDQVADDRRCPAFGAPRRKASGPRTQPKTVWSEKSGCPKKPPDPAEEAVQHGDQGDEGDQHRARCSGRASSPATRRSPPRR